MSPVSLVIHTEATVSIGLKNNKLLNSPLTTSLFIWKTRQGKARIPDQGFDPYPHHNGERT